MPRTPPNPSKPAESNRLQRTPLHYAAADAKPEDVTRLLLTGSDVNSQDKDGWTPLHFAAQSQCKEVVSLLLEAGASVDIPDCHGNTALFRAVFGYNGDGTVVELLRSSRANPRSKNHYGVSPVSLARTIANLEVARYFADITDTE
jgi:uncharacterized protein